MGAYLFAHFTGEGPDREQVCFSVSRDGLHWRDLNGGKPVLRSSLGTGGVRDPFLVRHPENGKIYIIATDLCIWADPDWIDAQNCASRDLIVWETEDLIHWDGPRACTVGPRRRRAASGRRRRYMTGRRAVFSYSLPPR